MNPKKLLILFDSYLVELGNMFWRTPKLVKYVSVLENNESNLLRPLHSVGWLVLRIALYPISGSGCRPKILLQLSDRMFI